MGKEHIDRPFSGLRFADKENGADDQDGEDDENGARYCFPQKVRW